MQPQGHVYNCINLYVYSDYCGLNVYGVEEDGRAYR